MAIIGRLMVPEDVQILIHETHEYVTLHGTRDFADVIKLRILRWENFPALYGLAQ